MWIKTPLIIDSGQIIYPGGKSFWSESSKIGSYLVGEYSGNLVDEQGIKLFEWGEFTEEKNYGKIITVLAYSKRWTIEEKAMIEFLSLDNPSDTAENRIKAAGIRQSLKDLDRATFIDLSREDTRSNTIDTCKILEQAGVISDYRQRSSEILDAFPKWEELPLFIQEQYLSEHNV